MPDIDTPSTPPTNIAGKPEVAWLVLDTAPLVDKNMSLLPETKYSKLYTIPEVIEEVRDEEARIHLNNLMTMGRITIKQPDEEAMSRVREFSRLTGDLHALSAVDLKVLALTWMLEKEAYSGNLEHLRAKPVEVSEIDTGCQWTVPPHPVSPLLKKNTNYYSPESIHQIFLAVMHLQIRLKNKKGRMRILRPWQGYRKKCSR